jgi:hypothetical protein
MDKATIVSIFPYRIFQRHIMMRPTFTEVPACKDMNVPVCHEIGTYSYNRYVLDGKSIKVPVSALEQANGIVNTFRRSIFYGSKTGNRLPGVEIVDGPITPEEFVEKYRTRHREMIEGQLNWYNALIELADGDWSIKKDKRLITQLQVDAARRMNIDKEWAKDAITERKESCPACFGSVHPDAVICIHCRTVIKPEEYAIKFGGNAETDGQNSLARMRAKADANKLQANTKVDNKESNQPSA